MRVATKLTLAFGVLVVIFAGLMVYHVRTIHHAVSASYEMSEISSRLYLSGTRQMAWLNALEENASKFWVTRDPGYLERFQEVYVEFDDGMQALVAAPTSPTERAEVARLNEMWRAFRPVAARVAGDPEAPIAAVELREQLASMRFQLQRANDALQLAMQERLDASAAAARHAERLSWTAALGALLLSVLVLALVARSISRALNRLHRGTREVAQGNFEYRLPAEGDDEFAQVARDFNGMTQRLGELDRMKRDFLSKVSHDLKTPLASMRETVQAVLDGLAGPVTDRQRRLLELTDGSARRLSEMIIKILDLSAMEAGTLLLDSRPHEIRDVLEPAVDAVMPMGGHRDRRIAVHVPVRFRLECDRDRMIQVIVNLLENALKFSPPGAPVLLSARLVERGHPSVPEAHWRRLDVGERVDRAAVIEVSDTGKGVPDADKRRIFEHFFQSRNGDLASSRGVGLGLAICREIVDKHHGEIWVRDNAQGGSTFSVMLPRPLAAVAPVPALVAVPLHSVSVP